MENCKIELKNLEEWRSTLDACIRCGYCFEHCPISKYTGWESDTPRAKLIMIYGILAGKLEPSKEMMEKISSCFHCQRCSAACTSGVPLTEIFAAAKRDFSGTALESLGTTSETDLQCARCLVCIGTCPHDARAWSPEEARIVTDLTKCQGCGICLTVCPAKATKIGHTYGTGTDEMKKSVQNFLDKEQNPDGKAIVFGCNWSFYPGMQSSTMASDTSMSSDYQILINMCGGRIGKPLLLEPFVQDAWGVLVACCPDGECEHDGNKRAKIHIQELKDLFKTIDIDPERVQLVEISHGDKAGFQKAVDQFMETVNALGPISGS